MNTKLSNSIKSLLKRKGFDLEHESKMTQARILSPLLAIIEDRRITQLELEESTGLKQPFLSGLFNQRRKLNMEHIALLQEALNVKLQPPAYLDNEEHIEKFYSDNEYEPAKTNFIDDCAFNKEHFVRWVSTNKFTNNLDKGSYAVVHSGRISEKSLDKQIDSFMIDETYF